MGAPKQAEALSFPRTASPKVYRRLSRNDIEALIAAGSHVIIYNGYALKVNAWIPYHPGGDKAIMHMVGRDATDEINAYVPSSSLIEHIHQA